MRATLLVIFILLKSSFLFGINNVEIKDLSPTWEFYSEGTFKKWGGESVSSVYLTVDLGNYAGYDLDIHCSSEFRLFVNGELTIGRQREILLSVDSLISQYGGLINLTIHFTHKTGLDDLKTGIVASGELSGVEAEELNRQEGGFRDFVISATIFLLLYLILVIRLNPRLAGDYLSLAKLLSLRESEDISGYSKLTGFNLLYFILISLTLSLFILIMAQQDSTFSFLINLEGETFAGSVWVWLRLSLTVLVLLLLKSFLIYLLAFLFGFSEAPEFHLLNFLRIVLLVSNILWATSSLYFIVHGEHGEVYYFLFRVSGFMLMVWVILMYFKMSNRLAYSAFHLFSYLCATELVTLIVLAKVLYQ